MIIIQARMGSSRLPGKILKPLGDSSVLDYVVSRCKQIKQADQVVVATSDLQTDDQVEAWCREHDVLCFRGSETDVLARYFHCAQIYQPDYVVRVTADCPFVDYQTAGELIDQIQRTDKDYIKVEGNLARGLIAEAFAYRSLEYIYQHGHEPRHREHVTYFAYEYPELFQSAIYHAPKYLCQPELRITLDTEADYQVMKQIADHFQDKLVCTEKVVHFLLDHPEIAKLNAHIKQKPVQ